jgi:hypothetical protein
MRLTRVFVAPTALAYLSTWSIAARQRESETGGIVYGVDAFTHAIEIPNAATSYMRAYRYEADNAELLRVVHAIQGSEPLTYLAPFHTHIGNAVPSSGDGEIVRAPVMFIVGGNGEVACWDVNTRERIEIIPN